VHLAHYLTLTHRAETALQDAYRAVAQDHADEPDVYFTCQRLAGQCAEHTRLLQPSADRYGEDAPEEPERLHPNLFTGTRTGALGLLRDLHDLYLMATQSQLCWTVIAQAAQGARDNELLDVVQRCQPQTTLQVKWLLTRIKQAAPQALVVAG
jgi:hypothetical protein